MAFDYYGFNNSRFKSARCIDQCEGRLKVTYNERLGQTRFWSQLIQVVLKDVQAYEFLPGKEKTTNNTLLAIKLNPDSMRLNACLIPLEVYKDPVFKDGIIKIEEQLQVSLWVF
jgi:hypothetical protein